MRRRLPRICPTPTAAPVADQKRLRLPLALARVWLSWLSQHSYACDVWLGSPGVLNMLTYTNE
eukprot:8907289-Pyramimonas_sp.AAC.1